MGISRSQLTPYLLKEGESIRGKMMINDKIIAKLSKNTENLDPHK